jgi:ATP-binding cassette subfamily B protein
MKLFYGILSASPQVKRYFLWALFIIFASSAASMSSLILFKGVIDDLMVHAADVLDILKWICLYLGLQMLGRFLSDYAFLVYGRFDQGAQKALGQYVFHHLHGLSLRVYLERHLGSLAHIVDHGFSGFRNLFYNLFVGILPLTFDVLLIMGLLYFFYGPLLASLSLGFVITYFLLTNLFSSKIDCEQQIYMGHIRTAFGKCFDSLMNYETVKCFGNEDRIAREFNEELEKLETTSLQAIKTTSQLGYAQSALAAFFMGTMLVMMGMQVATHQFQIGDLVVVNLYMLQLTRPLSLLGNQIRTIKNSLFELEALFTLLSQKSEITDAFDAIPLTSIQEIVFKNVAFAHHVDKPVFQHLNLTLRKGERVAVVGSSGSGKTTLTRLLFRLYDIDRGEILINGRNIKQYRIDSLRRHISIVPQDVVLFNDTILRNIQFGNPEASFEEIEKAAQKAGIHPFILSLPGQYETMVGERGMKLSGGERQRVGIARAILKNPDLYIFDEATSSLDTKTEKEIQQNLLEISANKTALIIAHRLSTVVDCDRILVMHAGEVVEQGTHEELLQAGGLYASLWKAQSGGKKIQA